MCHVEPNGFSEVSRTCYYTSIEDLNLFYEVGDPPYGQNWQSPNGVMFDQPYLTRTDGVSQGQHFPFRCPTPGSPANKTLNYSQFLPLSYVPGYDIHNRMPYADKLQTDRASK